MPALQPRETITLTREEARSLQAVAECSDDIRSQLILFGLHMGMRPGELLGLRRDIDWNNGFIQVRQTVAQLRKRGLVIQENRAKNRTSMGARRAHRGRESGSGPRGSDPEPADPGSWLGVGRPQPGLHKPNRAPG